MRNVLFFGLQGIHFFSLQGRITHSPLFKIMKGVGERYMENSAEKGGDVPLIIGIAVLSVICRRQYSTQM